MSKGWDNATLKKLKGLVGKGLSTSEVGKRLGLSKNAVVGKLNRLGWNSRAGVVDDNTAKTANKTATIKKTVAKGVAKKTVAKSSSVKNKAKVPAKKSGLAATKADKKTAQETVKKTVIKQSDKPKETKSTKTSSKNLAMHQRIIQHSLEMANLKPNQCRWPIGDPDSENFHFCGKQVFTGKPYCYEHCRLAYQFTPPKKK